MMQALSFVESGAYHQWDLDQRHLVLACSSHSGEKSHTDLVMDWLQRLQLQEDDLVCGAHMPYNEYTAHDLIRHDQKAKRRHNNCSGKHTSMLSTLKMLKIDHKNYGSYDHKLQKRLRQILSEISGENLEKATWGVDGCGIPTYVMSLKSIAQGLRHFLPEEKNISTDRKEACRLIREAVLAHPYFIGGTGDCCTEMMSLAKDRLLLKSGAEGVYAGVMLKQGLSFALKVRDGHPRASRVAMAEILLQFKALLESEYLQLSSHTQPTLRNWEGLAVGKIFVPKGLMS
jgi:L-asparaginase II